MRQRRELFEGALGKLIELKLNQSTNNLSKAQANELLRKATVALECLLRDEERFHDDLAAGGDPSCPCCGRKASLRKRKLNAGMARVLMRIYYITPRSDDGWVHIQDIFQSTAQKFRDWTQLKHWGLIVPKKARTKTENSSGYWRITELGKAFVEKRAEVPKYAFIYNDFCLTRSSEKLNIIEALSSKFSYEELMENYQ